MQQFKRDRNHKASFFVLTYKAFLMCILLLLITFSIVVTLSYPAFKNQLYSSVVYQTLSNYKAESLFLLINQENHHFAQAMDKPFEHISLSAAALELATSIRPEDSRSLLGSELPGFRIFDTKIIIAGEGTDYTTLPYESSPPLETILEERELAENEVKKIGEGEEDEETKPLNPSLTTGDRKVMYIYHTHSRESFLPYLQGTGDISTAQSSKVNVTMLGTKLGEELRERGIGTEVDISDVPQKLGERGWKYTKSYSYSRELVETAMASNRELTYFFDLHRDSQPRNVTTKEIKGKEYARLFFIVGTAHQNYDQNLNLATELHERLEKKFPGISRGVFEKSKKQGNGVYNQDLSANSLIIEIGGVENKFEEMNRTIEVLADVFSEYYWQAEKVNAQ